MTEPDGCGEMGADSADSTVDAGVFISFEGCEGCGKSTQAALLSERLAGKGVHSLMTREPGGTPTGDMIREILQHHASGEAIEPWTEVMLFAASRAQHVANVIGPALEKGQWVLCDRFVDSSLAYQAGGRELCLNSVLRVNEIAVAGCWPQVTLWFDLPVEEALHRARSRGGREDRFESEALEFHRRVRDMYARLAERFPTRIVRVDACGEAGEIHEQVWNLLGSLHGRAE